MEINMLQLDRDTLGDIHCTVGEEKILSVPVRVVKYGDAGATFDVTGPVTVEETPEEAAPEAAPEGEAGGYGETAPAVNAMLARRAA